MGQTYRKPQGPPLRSEERSCLMCGTEFISEGPHNRICRRCRSSQLWRDGC